MLIVLSKILIAVSLLGLLRCSHTFRSMSREFDDLALAALKRIMHATKESGYPPQLIPLLMLLTALSFMLSAFFTTAGGR